MTVRTGRPGDTVSPGSRCLMVTTPGKGTVIRALERAASTWATAASAWETMALWAATRSGRSPSSRICTRSRAWSTRGLDHPGLRLGFVQHLPADGPAVEEASSPIQIPAGISQLLLGPPQRCLPLGDLSRPKPGGHLSQEGPGRFHLGLRCPLSGIQLLRVQPGHLVPFPNRVPVIRTDPPNAACHLESQVRLTSLDRPRSLDLPRPFPPAGDQKGSESQGKEERAPHSSTSSISAGHFAADRHRTISMFA